MTRLTGIRIVLSEPLRKEPLIAIILGSAIGIAVAFSLWRISLGSDSHKSEDKKQTETSLIQDAGAQNEFAIVSPSDFHVVSDDTVEVTGFANSGAVIAAYGADTAIGKANTSGEFSLSVELKTGVNKIPVWSLERGKPPEKIELTLVYTNELSSDVSATATFGTVTDITEDTLQVRSSSGEIAQLAISSETTYVKVIDDPDDIEFSDVAIGDYIAALGTSNNNVINVQRILVTTEPESPSVEAVIGTINVLSSSEFLISKSESNEEVSIDATNGATTYSAREQEIATSRLSTSKEGDEIIVIGNFEDNELVADIIVLL